MAHAGADVFLDIVSGILHKYVRCAADLVLSSSEFLSIKGITSIMSSIADTVMQHFEDQHFKPIRERWLSTIDLYTTFFPVDASVRTAMFTMHAPLADMIMDALPHADVGGSKDACNKQMSVALRKIEMRPSGARAGGARSPTSSNNAEDMVDDVIAELNRQGKCSASKLDDIITRCLREHLIECEPLPANTACTAQRSACDLCARSLLVIFFPICSSLISLFRHQ